MSDPIGQEAPAPASSPPHGPPPRRPRRSGRWWRWPVTALILLVEGVFLIAAIGGSLLAWRSAQGPVDLSWLLPRIGRIVAVAEPDIDVAIGHLAIAWQGFTKGPDQPVQITAGAIAVSDRERDRSLEIGHLAVDLSAAWAVRGIFVPRVVTVDELRATLRRDPPAGASSAVAPSAGSHGLTGHDIIAVLEQPPETDKRLVKVKPAVLSQLQRIQVINGTVVLEPAIDLSTPEATKGLAAKVLQLGQISADIARGAEGGLTGHISAVLATRAGPLPAQTAKLRPSLSAEIAITTAGLAHLQVQAKLDDPAGMMAAIGVASTTPVPAMPLQTSIDVSTTADAAVTAFKADLTGGAGQVLMNGAAIPVSSLLLSLSGDQTHVAIDPGSQLVFGAVSSAPPPTVTLGGRAERKADGVAATLTLGIDHVASNDLPAYWPPKLAGGARDWIKAQIQDGVVHDGALQIGLRGAPDLTNLEVVSTSGQLPASGLTVAWLPPLPPLTNVEGAIVLQGPDAIAVTVSKAQQGALAVSNSGIVITGLNADEQIGTITVNTAGPVAAALALINHPRLRLLQKVPVPLNATGGTMTTRVQLRLPLDAKVTTSQIAMQVHTVIQNLALENLVLGRNLSDGNLTIDADMAKLHLSGAAAFAAIPTQLTLDTSFADGPPDQVVASLNATATIDQAMLAAANFPTGGVLNGSATVGLALKALHSGRTNIDAAVTLPASHLRISQISWAGGTGEAKATAHIALQGSQIVAFDNINLTGPGMAVRVHSTFAGNRLSTITADQLVLGQTDLHGSVGLPATPSAPYVIDVGGKALDLSGVFGGPKVVKPTVAPANQALSSISSKSEFAPHPPWRATINLDRIIFGRTAAGLSRELDQVHGLGVNNGVVVASAEVSLKVSPSGSLTHLTIVPDGNGSRNVTLTSGDLGGLLKATNAYDAITGGALRVDAIYNDRLPNHPLSGTAQMEKFSLGDAPAIAKVLQAATLYGVVDLMHGPGLFFSKMIAPFHLADRRLDLSQARAYSASLGLTAHGSVDLPNNKFNIEGTVVPAYFFNSLLGHIPLIGKLFSPEKGGGVFAVKYALIGPIDDPEVQVHPMSLITPGFLRDLFGSDTGGTGK